MNIKTRLSFEFTGIVAVILLFFAGLVYYLSYTTQLARYREDLLNSAKNTTILLIDVVEVDSLLLKKIQRETILLDDEEIIITNSASKVIYSNNEKYLTDKIIEQYSAKKDISYFSVGEKDGVFYKHHFRNQYYNVFVMATDHNRIKNLSDLKKILFWSVLFSIWLSTMFSYLFSKNAIKPISRIIKNVKNINSAKLSDRLKEGRGNDEIAQLSRTFNEMLASLEIAFNNQKDFVSNASHELRTPLSVMILESDYLLSKEQSAEGYKKHISRLVNDLKKLNTQLNSLLELAQISHDKKIQLKSIRIDEIVYDAIQQIKIKYPARKIISKIQYPENENELLINGNAGLLNIVFKNLIDNACKFSDDDVNIEFLMAEDHIKIIISDKGIGIPPIDLERIYSPFGRASNVKFKSGFGIGLSIVAKILEIHEVSLIIDSKENVGTKFSMHFKKNKGQRLEFIDDA
ncbi:MAG: HAMP domain-containing sensor histidine kinase [Bacteroidales bacterium]|jgi:signal transduction histidine kinase|nr:HAMP domain-containing histidine kinase [Bacteroidales bacterium]